MFSTGRSSQEDPEQDDFILKLVRQIIRALADIAKLRQGGKLEQALAEVNEAYRSLLDIDPTVLHLFGSDTLIRLSGDRGQLEPLALLLWEEACIRSEQRETVWRRV